MRNLNKDWITEYTLGPEYKKYVLLDYLQSVSDDFSKVCLYPALADIIVMHCNCKRKTSTGGTASGDNNRIVFTSRSHGS
jgi:hypothetical protein